MQRRILPIFLKDKRHCIHETKRGYNLNLFPEKKKTVLGICKHDSRYKTLVELEDKAEKNLLRSRVGAGEEMENR